MLTGGIVDAVDASPVAQPAKPVVGERKRERERGPRRERGRHRLRGSDARTDSNYYKFNIAIKV